MVNPPDVEYSVEYAKSGRSHCTGCKQAIVRGDVRWGETIALPPDHGKARAPSTKWRHFPGCLGSEHLPADRVAKAAIHQYGGAAALPGLEGLRDADREWVVETLRAVGEGEKPPKPPHGAAAEEEAQAAPETPAPGKRKRKREA